MDKTKTKQQLLLDNEELRTRLEEAEEPCGPSAPGSGRSGGLRYARGTNLHFAGGRPPYRILLETMEEERHLE